MAITAKAGTFAAATTTGNQVVDTGAGVEGKVVLLFGHKVTAAGNDTDLELAFGCATSSTARWTVWSEMKDGLTQSQASRRYDDTKCLIFYEANGPAVNGEADFVSFGTGADGGKFTINWTDAPGGAYIIHYLFLGGADIANAKAGSFTYPTATGNQDVTDPGFQPDFVLLSSPFEAADAGGAPGSSVHAKLAIGMATSSSNRGCLAFQSENFRTTYDNYRYQSTSRVFTAINNQADVDVADFVSFLSNGFRLNWSVLGSAAGTAEVFYLAIKGCQAQVGSFSTQTSTGNFNVSTNFQGKAALFMSSLSANGTHTANAGFSLGIATGSTARSVIGGADDEATKTADTRSSTSLIYTNITSGTPTVNGEIDFVSFNSSNMTLNQTDADPSAQTVIFVVFGDSPTQTLSPTGIASGEAFGSATIARGAVSVAPSAIASAEAFGSHSIQVGAVTVTVTGIASAEAVGSHTVQRGAVTVAVTGIASGEAFGVAQLNLVLLPSGITSAEVVGSHTIQKGAVTVSPSGVASAEAFGSHSIQVGAVTVTVTGIASAEAVGSHTVQRGAVTVSPSAIASGEAFGSAVVQVGGVTLLVTAIASAEAFGSHTVQRGAVSVLPSAIASAEAFGSAVVQSGTLTLLVTAIASAEAFGSATIQPGAVAVIPSGVASAEAFGAPQINLTILLAGIASAEAFGSHAVQRGAVSVTPSAIASAEAFGSAVVQSGTLTLLVTAIGSGEAFGSATIQPGAVAVSPSGVASAEAFGAPRINLTILLAGIASAEAFGSHTLQRGAVSVLPSAIASAEAFGNAIVSSGVLFILPSAIASGEAFGSHTLQPGGVAVSPSAIGSAESFGVAKLNLAIAVSGVASGEAFGSAIVQPGVVLVSPSGIASAEALGTAIVSVGALVLSPTGIGSQEAFGTLLLQLYVTPSGIASAEAMGTPSVTFPPTIIQPSGIASAEAFGVAVIVPGAVIVLASGIASGEAFGTAIVLLAGAVPQPISIVYIKAALNHLVTVIAPLSNVSVVGQKVGSNMATELNIRNRVAGDDLKLEVEVPGLLASQTLVKAWATIKQSKAHLDAQAVANESITAGFTYGATVSGKRSAFFSIVIPRAKTLLCTPLKTYHIDVQVKTNDDLIDTPALGTIVFDKQVTDSTS